MFDGCSPIKELNLSNFHTNKVNDMSFMFSFCLSLEELNLSNFNTNNVTEINGIFNGSLEELKKKIKVRYKNITEKAFYD